jgi:hypothetical protein
VNGFGKASGNGTKDSFNKVPSALLEVSQTGRVEAFGVALASHLQGDGLVLVEDRFSLIVGEAAAA